MSNSVAAHSLVRRVLWYYVPVLAYAVLIATLSSIPYLGGPSLGKFGADKLVHAIEYGIFAWLLLRALKIGGSGLNRTSLLLVALLLLAGYAALDEFLQSFVPGRTSSIADIAADFCGGALVGWFWRSKHEGD